MGSSRSCRSEQGSTPNRIPVHRSSMDMSTTQICRHAVSGLASQRCPPTRQLMPNRVRNVNRFHISYNNHAADYGCATTALVLNGRVFFVLNGDHVCEM